MRRAMGRSRQLSYASSSDWHELDDSFRDAIDPGTGLMTIAGGSKPLLPPPLLLLWPRRCCRLHRALGSLSLCLP